MNKRCVICGVEFDSYGNAKTCGAVCRKEKKRQYRQTPERKEYMRQYQQTPEYKEYMRQCKQSARTRLAFFQTIGMVDAVLKAE